MQKIKYKGLEYEFKNTIADMTVGDFERVSHIIGRETYDLKQSDILSPIISKDQVSALLKQIAALENWFEALQYLGIPKEVLDELDEIDFGKCVSAITLTSTNDEMVKTIEVNGITFTAYEGDEYRIKMKTLKDIQKYTQFHPTNVFRFVLAAIFKAEEVPDIYERAAMFGEVNAELVFPYLKYTSEKLIASLASYYGQPEL